MTCNNLIRASGIKWLHVLIHHRMITTPQGSFKFLNFKIQFPYSEIHRYLACHLSCSRGTCWVTPVPPNTEHFPHCWVAPPPHSPQRPQPFWVLSPWISFASSGRWRNTHSMAISASAFFVSAVRLHVRSCRWMDYRFYRMRDHSLSTCSSIAGHSGCFQFRATRNRLARHSCTSLFVDLLLLIWEIPLTVGCWLQGQVYLLAIG